MQAIKSNFLNGCEKMIAAADETIQIFQNELAKREISKQTEELQEFFTETQGVLKDIQNFVAYPSKDQMYTILFKYIGLIDDVWSRAMNYVHEYVGAASITSQAIKTTFAGYKTEMNDLLDAFVDDIRKLILSFVYARVGS